MTNVDSRKLQTLYLAYFGRPGDPSGINYWLSRPQELLNIREISNELSRQDEYTKYISHEKLSISLTASDIIEHLQYVF